MSDEFDEVVIFPGQASRSLHQVRRICDHRLEKSAISLGLFDVFVE